MTGRARGASAAPIVARFPFSCRTARDRRRPAVTGESSLSLPFTECAGLDTEGHAGFLDRVAFAVYGDYRLLNQLSLEIPSILLTWCARSGCLVSSRNNKLCSIVSLPSSMPINISLALVATGFNAKPPSAGSHLDFSAALL